MGVFYFFIFFRYIANALKKFTFIASISRKLEVLMLNKANGESLWR